MTSRRRELLWASVLAACLFGAIPVVRWVRTHVCAARFDPASGQVPPEAGVLTGTVESTQPPAAWDAGKGTLVDHGGQMLIPTVGESTAPSR